MTHIAKIQKAKFTDDTSIMQVEIKENILETLKRNKTKYIEITIPDTRIINHEQRKKIYATLNDISSYAGDAPERIKEYFKYKLNENVNMKTLGKICEFFDCNIGDIVDFLKE